MQMKLYINKTDARYMPKDIEQVGDTITSLYLKDETNVVDPIIILDDFPTGINYCYLDLFDRYYYLTNVEMLNGLFQTTWHVDVLQSFQNDITNQSVIAKRCENIDYIDYYLQDSEFKADQYTKDQYLQFTGASAFDNTKSEYILAVMGTGGDTPDSGEIDVKIINPESDPVNVGGTIAQYETDPPTPPTPPT